MRIILMAAGVGSRISRFINQPKSTLPVNGKPLIAETVDMLLEKGAKVAVITGFMNEYVEKALEGRDVKFYRNPFFRETNSMGSLWFARDFITDDEDLILANADVYWGEGIYDALMGCRDEISMLADESRVDTGDYFFKVENGCITKYGKELTRAERTTEYVGMAKISKNRTMGFKAHLEHMVENEQYDLWWENVLYQYCVEEPIHITDVSDHFWAEIDYIEDYKRINKYLETGDVSCKNAQFL